MGRWFTPSKGPATDDSKLTPPAAPDPTIAENKAKEELLEKRRRKTRTILTSAQGDLSDAGTTKKTLLGA